MALSDIIKNVLAGHPETGAEEDLESTSFHPISWDDIIGQQHIKDALKIYITAAKRQNVPLDHVLLKGPAGLGKTAFAGAIAAEFDNAPVLHVTGPQITRDSLEQLVSRIAEAAHTSISNTCILFIDEIHGIDRHSATILLPLLEYFRYGDQILPRFTCIGATTDPARLLPPFRRRFQIQFDLDYYSELEIKRIIKKNLCRVLGVDDAGLSALVRDESALDEVAQISRGTPWRAVIFATRLRDFMIEQDGTYQQITNELVSRMRQALDIDDYGLERKDRKILVEMMVRFRMRAVGVRSVAAAVGEDPKTLEEIIEPDLVRLGFINREPRGRALTTLGIEAATATLKRLNEQRKAEEVAG